MSFHPADSRTLQIDLDSGWTPAPFELLSLLQENKHIRIKSVTVTESKTRNHYHVTVKLAKPLPAMARVALQAICGSDQFREAMNYMRVRNRAPHPILFIEKSK